MLGHSARHGSRSVVGRPKMAKSHNNSHQAEDLVAFPTALQPHAALPGGGVLELCNGVDGISVDLGRMPREGRGVRRTASGMNESRRRLGKSEATKTLRQARL